MSQVRGCNGTLGRLVGDWGRVRGMWVEHDRRHGLPAVIRRVYVVYVFVHLYFMHYYSILFDGQKRVGEAVFQAESAEAARDKASVQWSSIVNFSRFPDNKFTIVVSERPYPGGLRLIEAEGEMILVPPSYMGLG